DGDSVGALDLADQAQVRQAFDLGDRLGDPERPVGPVGNSHAGSVAAPVYAEVTAFGASRDGGKRKPRRNPAMAQRTHGYGRHRSFPHDQAATALARPAAGGAVAERG